MDRLGGAAAGLEWRAGVRRAGHRGIRHRSGVFRAGVVAAVHHTHAHGHYLQSRAGVRRAHLLSGSARATWPPRAARSRTDPSRHRARGAERSHASRRGIAWPGHRVPRRRLLDTKSHVYVSRGGGFRNLLRRLGDDDIHGVVHGRSGLVALLEGSDFGLVLEGHTDVVKTFEQDLLAEWVDLEGEFEREIVDDGLVGKVGGQAISDVLLSAA